MCIKSFTVFESQFYACQDLDGDLYNKLGIFYTSNIYCGRAGGLSQYSQNIYFIYSLTVQVLMLENLINFDKFKLAFCRSTERSSYYETFIFIKFEIRILFKKERYRIISIN